MGASGTPTEVLTAYMRERYPTRVYLPLALFLGAAALTGGSGVGLVEVAAATVLAYSLVFQFRLWDDLSDRSSDRAAHPQRVLSRAGLTGPFVGLLVTVATANTALLASRPGAAPRLAGFAMLTGGLLCWYSWRKTQPVNAVLSYHVVLLKYPVLALLVSAPRAMRERSTLLVAAAVVYLSFCAYEVLHDNRLHDARGAALVLAVESVLLAGAPTLLRTVRAAAGLSLAVPVTTALAVLLLLGLARRRLVTPYAAFAAAALQLLTLSVGG
jgi:drug/metabolite transporter superfamily protein YnfA